MRGTSNCIDNETQGGISDGIGTQGGITRDGIDTSGGISTGTGNG